MQNEKWGGRGLDLKMILHRCVDFTVTVHDENNGEPLMNVSKR